MEDLLRIIWMCDYIIIAVFDTAPYGHCPSTHKTGGKSAFFPSRKQDGNHWVSFFWRIINLFEFWLLILILHLRKKGSKSIMITITTWHVLPFSWLAYTCRPALEFFLEVFQEIHNTKITCFEFQILYFKFPALYYLFY